MSIKTRRVRKRGKDALDAWRRKWWASKYACRKSVRQVRP